VEPVDRSTIWPYDSGEPGRFYYQRYAHPTGVAAEDALGELEGGHALLFPSGTGAIAALVLSLLEPGQTIALAEGAYFGTGRLFAGLEKWGLRYVEFDQTGPPPDSADLVFLEAPSNPFLTMPDLEAAAAHPGRVVVDSTAATPVYLRPLEHGADFAVHSATKYLGGHHDVLLGAVVCRSAEEADRLREFRTLTGIVAAPDPSWLLLRSLKTLRVRMERITATAQVLVERLRDHSAVQVVRYPGFGGIVCVVLAAGADAADLVTRSTSLWVHATSLGGVESTLERRRRWKAEAATIPDGLIRLSVGIEDVEDLWADLDRALGAAL